METARGTADAGPGCTELAAVAPIDGGGGASPGGGVETRADGGNGGGVLRRPGASEGRDDAPAAMASASAGSRASSWIVWLARAGGAGFCESLMTWLAP
jgi:hypothetical protein